jgi:hypothetical protein
MPVNVGEMETTVEYAPEPAGASAPNASDDAPAERGRRRAERARRVALRTRAEGYDD